MQQHVCRSTTGFVCTHTYKRTEYRCHIVDVMDDVTHRLYIAFTLRAIYLHIYIGHESLKYSTTFVKCGLLHYQVWLIGSVYRTNIAQMAHLITAPTKQTYFFLLINFCLVCCMLESYIVRTNHFVGTVATVKHWSEIWFSTLSHTRQLFKFEEFIVLRHD